MPNNDSHQHVVKTSEQWNERIVEFWVVPRGCLCVELTPNGKTKIKIGEGNKYYSQLPYICDGDDLSQYYTKEEVNNLFDNFNRMAIMSTDEYDRKADLPMTGNKLGDVRFVKSSSPSITIDPDIYLWNGRKWIYVGNQFPEIDLNKYLKKTEFHELFDPVKERVDDIGPKVDEMYPMRHTHANKDILDNTTASYTSEEKIKLAGLHNYDVEISDLQSKSHTHDNKSFLDTITQEYQIWSQEDRYKFDHIKNYDQDIAEIRVDIQTLESIAHTHANKNILDQVTAAFTVEDKTKLDSLHNDAPFIGTDGMYPGVEGNVPAPLTTDVGKFLSSDGTWRPISEASDFIGATDERDGYHGLVPAPSAGGENKFLRGDGTWANVSTSDIKARQSIDTSNKNYPLLFSYAETSDTKDDIDNTTRRNNSIYANPSAGTITANKFYGDITGDGLNAGIYDLLNTDNPIFNGTEWMLTSIPSSSGGTSTPSFRRVKTAKFADYVSSTSRTVLFDQSDNTSKSISLSTPPTDTQYLKLYFKSSGNMGQPSVDNSVYSIAEVPYMTGVSLGGILQVAQTSDNQGVLRLTALAFTVDITTGNPYTLRLIKVSKASRISGSGVSDDSSLSANIIKVVAYR